MLNKRNYLKKCDVSVKPFIARHGSTVTLLRFFTKNKVKQNWYVQYCKIDCYNKKPKCEKYVSKLLHFP